MQVSHLKWRTIWSVFIQFVLMHIFFSYHASQKYSMKYHYGPTRSLFPAYHRFAQLMAYVCRDFLLEICREKNVESKLIESLENMKLSFDVMPYPSYLGTGASTLNTHDIIAVITTVCYVLVCPIIVKRIADEKASKVSHYSKSWSLILFDNELSLQVKEMLNMIGMSDMVSIFV